MSKWRPTKSGNIYVIPDIHGEVNMLNSIFNRILPLRKKDKIILLGDYIDRHINSPEVLDALIVLKDKYQDQIILLLGNHEQMLLDGLNGDQHAFDMWIMNGGYYTALAYSNKAGLKTPPKSSKRIKGLIPKEHIEFMQGLMPYYETDDYIFVHGGCDPFIPLSDHPKEVLIWDRSLLKYVLADNDLTWRKCVITGHNATGRGEPVIKDKFMMLDCGSPKKLLVVELNSMEAWMATPNKRLTKFELKETNTTKKPVFRRIS